jgi:hypothetical protein
MINGRQTASVLTKERALGSFEQFLGVQGLCENYSNTKWPATLDEQVRLAQATGCADLFCIGWITIGALMASMYQLTRSSHRCHRITRAMIAWQDIFPPVRPRTVQRSIVVSCSQWQNRTV